MQEFAADENADQRGAAGRGERHVAEYGERSEPEGEDGGNHRGDTEGLFGDRLADLENRHDGRYGDQEAGKRYARIV